MMEFRGLRWTVVLIGLATFSFAAGVRAQMGMGMRAPDIQGIFHPVVGAGASYDMTDGKQKKHSLEITVVGKEAVNGKDAYWLETGVQDERGGMMYMKMLASVDQNNLVTERFIMQPPGQAQPMEMTVNISMMGGKKQQSTDFRDKAEQMGTESITVPGGTFECTHYRMKDGSGDAWVSPKVAPWGLVKFSGKDSSMVLTKQISDAKDQITGKPIKFDPMQMMQQMGQKPPKP